jgi:cob(I)alamin adenosyltransferase
MKIYTRTGDDGTTSLVGGTRQPKNSPRVEAYGTVDELNAHLGLLSASPWAYHHSHQLLQIQRELFRVGAILATDLPPDDPRHLHCTPDAVEELEKAIDRIQPNLTPVDGFIIPGGNTLVATCHVARAVCRRAERRVITLAEQQHVDENITPYLNRLSDYLFVLSRDLARALDAPEHTWNP